MAAIDRRLPSRDGLDLFVREYPHPDPEGVVLCLPGLTANSLDFEDLAPHLQTRWRVLTPDLRGRGRSDFDPDARGPVTTHDLMDVFHLLDQLGIARVVVVATSLSGQTAIAMGAFSGGAPLGAPMEAFRNALPPHAGVVEALVLNDMGPEIGGDPSEAGAAWRRIADEPVASWAEAAAQQRELAEGIPADYGDEDWLRVARRRYREDPSGVPVLAHHPGILPPAPPPGAGPAPAPPDLWPLFDALGETPILALRGEHSKVLTPACLAEMQRRHAGLRGVTIEGRGHCPSLDEPGARRAIDAFLHDVVEAR